MNKIQLYIIIGLLAVISFGYIYMNWRHNQLQNEYFDLENSLKEEQKRIRDSAFTEIDLIIKNADHKFDSVVNLPPEIKFIPYEKPVYPDRTLDDALEIHNDYKKHTLNN